MREMMSTDLSWIKNIPTEWRVIPNKYIFSKIKNVVGCYNGEPILSLTINGVKIRNDEEFKGKKAVSYDDYQVCYPGNLLMCLFDIDVTPRCIGLIMDNGLTTSAYTQFVVADNNDPKYYYYYYLSLDYTKTLLHMSRNIRSSLTADDFGRIYTIQPPLSEQQAIVRYLDSKCASIDEAMERHKKIIEKLKENESSLVFEIITQGLHRGKRLQETDIRWAKRIPAHWTPRRIKYSVEIRNGSDPQTEGDIPVYGSGAKSFKTCGEYKCPPTVLLGRKGATLHIPHYIDHPYWNVDTAFDTKPLNSTNMRWFYYVARCLDYKYFITQTTLPSMTQTDYGNMVVPTPPIPEQAEIAEYLDKKTSLLQDAISRHQDIIEKFEEYRKSIIYNAVTGKIDCRTEV